MKTEYSHRNRVVVIGLALVVALSVLWVSRAQADPIPNSMAALGDSITVAFNTGGFPYIDAPQNSWSTGSGSSVSSLYRRFLAQNTAIANQNYNFARSGAKVADLNGQAARVGANVEYVTILIGGNDVCTSSVSTMTSAADFRRDFAAAMATLHRQASAARIYVLSIPNVQYLFNAYRYSFSAQLVWAIGGICQSMLARPWSNSSTDRARREAVITRTRELNGVLREVCALYVLCRYDNDAVFNTPFGASDITTRDYFHPSLAGQNKLACVAWNNSGFGMCSP
jgi:lysophospholipase L1-like esterase